jgi:hypothetical protein
VFKEPFRDLPIRHDHADERLYRAAQMRFREDMMNEIEDSTSKEYDFMSSCLAQLAGFSGRQGLKIGALQRNLQRNGSTTTNGRT